MSTAVTTTTITINNYCTLSQVKRKLKSHLRDTSREYLKISNYGQSIVFTSVDIFNEIITDSLKYVSKNDITGLYKLNTVIVKLVVNEMSKYHFLLKYLPKFNTSINYQDLLFFNYKKTLQFIENKLGNKLMIEYSTLNLISYLLLSLQYDLINLSVLFVEYSKKKTLSKNTLLHSVYSLLDEELSSKIKLKLDCVIQEKECLGDEEEEGEEEDGEGEEEDNDGDSNNVDTKEINSDVVEVKAEKETLGKSKDGDKVGKDTSGKGKSNGSDKVDTVGRDTSGKVKSKDSDKVDTVGKSNGSEKVEVEIEAKVKSKGGEKAVVKKQ